MFIAYTLQVSYFLLLIALQVFKLFLLRKKPLAVLNTSARELIVTIMHLKVVQGTERTGQVMLFLKTRPQHMRH